MKRNILIALGMAFLPVVAIAAPNFSGSWVKDNAKSDPVPNQMYWLTRDAGAGGGRGGRGQVAGGPAGPVAGGAGQAGGRGQGGGGGRGQGGGGNAADMTVQQAANSLQITDQTGAVHKYTLDGKPMTRATETMIQKAVVTANVQGDTLVIGTTQPFAGMPGNATLEVKDVWSLSADGKVLTITTTRSLPAEQKTFKQVYNLK